jgi:hypothetical protein
LQIAAQQKDIFDTVSQQRYQRESLRNIPFDHKQWEKLKKKLDIKEYKPAKKHNRQSKNWNFSLPASWKTIIKWSMFAAVTGILFLFVLRLAGIHLFHKKIKVDGAVALDQLEEHLDTASIDPHLYKAIKSGNYRLAIRLYYLMILQKLTLKEKIRWKKYKTNRQYVHELQDKSEHSIMKHLTLLYERIWYGDTDITEAEYSRISPDFVNFLQNIH